METESIRDTRHPQDIGLSNRSTMVNDSRVAILFFLRAATEYRNIEIVVRRSFNTKGQSFRDLTSFLFLPFSFSFLPRTISVTFERVPLSSRTSFVHRRSEKRPVGSAVNSYSSRRVSGRVNGMIPAGVRISYAPIRGSEPMDRRRHPVIVLRDSCRVWSLLSRVLTTAIPRILRTFP